MPLSFELQPPGWVDSGARPTGGLDLVGLRLPVQAIGNSLLDGVTTVTPTIRYLGFRAWFAHSYMQARLPDAWDQFLAYSIRLEAAVVVGNLLVDGAMTGLIGPEKGGKLVESGVDPVPLGELVVTPATTIYTGPSDQLGISITRDGRAPGLTRERGVSLAEAVAASIEQSDLVRRLAEGAGEEAASVMELKALGELARVDKVPEAERAELTNILLPQSPRVEEKARVATYAALLTLGERLGRCPTEADLFSVAVSREAMGLSALEKAADGWLLYCVRDVLAMAHEAVLAAVVTELEAESGEDRRPVQARRVVDALLRRGGEHDDALRSFGLLGSNETFSELSFRVLHRRVVEATSTELRESAGLRRWRGDLTESRLGQLALRAGAGALALLPVAWLLAERRAAEGVRNGQEGFQQLSRQGWSRVGMAEVVLPILDRLLKEDTPVSQVMAMLAFRTIDQHLRVAWSRMQTDVRRDVALLVTDGSNWVPRRPFHGGRTASRLQQAIGWLKQLSLLGDAGTTTEGQKACQKALALLGGEGRA